MGRPRGFDEAEVIRSAASLFAGRAYDGVSVDDLVNHLGVHRNSLYQTFGSKRGLYLAALRHCVRHDVAALLARIGAAGSMAAAVRAATTRQPDGAGLDLLLLAAVERAPVDVEVAAVVTAALTALDQAMEPFAAAVRPATDPATDPTAHPTAHPTTDPAAPDPATDPAAPDPAAPDPASAAVSFVLGRWLRARIPA